MSENTYGIQLSQNLAKLAERYKTGNIHDTNPADGEAPPFINDYPKNVAAEGNLLLSSGPDKIIDVSPDQRSMVLFIINKVCQIYQDIPFKDAPCMTPTSLVGYCFAVLHALALLNDDENVRTSRSVYSREFASDRILSQYIDSLRNLVVPPFMKELLESLKANIDKRKEKLKFVYSYACFDYTHDFGRMFPVNIFFEASHLIATRPSNTDPAAVLEAWLRSSVTDGPTPRTVGHYIGINPADPYNTNWLSEALYQLFNPTTSRAHTLRPVFNSFRMRPQIHPNHNADTLNPYVYLLALDSNNRVNVIKTMTAISLELKKIEPSSEPLGSFQGTISGNNLINHYYQNVLKPTYITFDTTTSTTVVDIQSQQKFKTTPNFVKNVIIKPMPTGAQCTTNTYLVTEPSEEDVYPIVFETENDEYPTIDQIRHFLPSETHPQSIYQNIISGKLIEISELDSVAVPHPNPSNTISCENSYFLESAIPITHIRPIAPNLNDDFEIVERQVHPVPRTPTRVDLINRAVDRVPLFGPFVETDIPQYLPGYDYITNLPHTKFGCNSINYYISDDPTSSTISDAHRKPTAWSAYRYLNDTQYYNINIRASKYMILNFRTLFGLNVTMIETDHPSVLIPY